MDPVSRRLAAAAMGLVLGLSRDEELEKTRLDLERACMEREDFRNGEYTCSLNYGQLSKEYNETFRDLLSARSLLAKVVRENKRRKLSESIITGIVQHFRNADFDDDDVEEYAGDGLGEVSIGLSVSTDEDSGSQTTSDD